MKGNEPVCLIHKDQWDHAKGQPLEPTPSAAEKPHTRRAFKEDRNRIETSAAPVCRFCGRGPHSDSVGHSYLPKIERGEQQKWICRPASGALGGWMLETGIGESEWISDQYTAQRLTEKHNTELAAERQRREKAEESAQAAIAKDKEDAARIYHLIECAEKQAGNAMTFDEIKLSAHNIQARRTDLSLLHQHDAEVRRPLVDLLIEIRDLMPNWTMKDLKDRIDAATPAQCKETGTCDSTGHGQPL